MRRTTILLIIILCLAGCTAQTEDCKRYSDTSEINKLTGINTGKPAELIPTADDCSARYKKGDTTFDLYYWAYQSDDSFYTNYNHSLIMMTNCAGSLCEQMYQFHYLGPPRQLEVKCINGNLWMNDAGAIKEKKIDCHAFAGIGKFNQKTWKCDYNTIIEENCR
jgi:hypothetical protein